MGFVDDITAETDEDKNPYALNFDPSIGSKSFFINGGYWIAGGTVLGFFAGQGPITGAEFGAIGYGGLILYNKIAAVSDVIKDPVKAVTNGFKSFVHTLYEWGHAITGDPGDDTLYERFVLWTSRNIFGIDDSKTLTKEQYQARVASIKFTQDYQKLYGVPFYQGLHEYLKEYPELEGSKDPNVMNKFALWSYIRYVEPKSDFKIIRPPKFTVPDAGKLVENTFDKVLYANSFKPLQVAGRDKILKPVDGVKFVQTTRKFNPSPSANIPPPPPPIATPKLPMNKLRFDEVTRESARARSIARPTRNMVTRRTARVY